MGRKTKNKTDVLDGIMAILNSKYARWTGAFVLLGIAYQFGTAHQKASMQREYQLIDEQRIKDHNDRIDELRNKIYDLRDENAMLRQEINMYELRMEQKNGSKK